MLIRRAEMLDGSVVDLRVRDGRIAEMGAGLNEDGDKELDARGGLLLPGLHDHHIHLAATAASLASIRCGPPDIVDDAQLAAVLQEPGNGWLRGIGYHESVAGMIDRRWLDRVTPDRPVRVQHRSGRMWMLNSVALERLLARAPAPPQLERDAEGWTGRLFDADDWLRDAMGGARPALDRVGTLLARFGVTGVTDMTPTNDHAMARHFAAERVRNALPQHVVMAGRQQLERGDLAPDPPLSLVKLHLHEHHLPDFDATVMAIATAHEQGRGVAIHCISEVELVFALAALRDAGPIAGDRIEHASVAPDALVAQIAALGLAVCVQPNFVSERGDAYRAAIPSSDWSSLYRLRAFKTAGVPIAGGTDAPFGVPDPWAAMAAAVSRHTAGGEALGLPEALTPEEALDLFLANPTHLDRRRILAVGAVADLCLLDAPWREARRRLSADLVRATMIDGRLIHDRVDQSPGQRGTSADPTT